MGKNLVKYAAKVNLFTCVVQGKTTGPKCFGPLKDGRGYNDEMISFNCTDGTIVVKDANYGQRKNITIKCKVA